jgi:phage-related protein
MNTSTRRGPVKRRWRHYATPSGERPVDTYLDKLTDEDAARVMARMAKIRDEGTPAARHLVEDLWEARVDGLGLTHRILFTEEGAKGRILLAIAGFTKKSTKTPPRIIKMALRRRDEWRSRGA